jgi:hypothetical protein
MFHPESSKVRDGLVNSQFVPLLRFDHAID